MNTIDVSKAALLANLKLKFQKSRQNLINILPIFYSKVLEYEDLNKSEKLNRYISSIKTNVEDLDFTSTIFFSENPEYLNYQIHDTNYLESIDEIITYIGSCLRENSLSLSSVYTVHKLTKSLLQFFHTLYRIADEDLKKESLISDLQNEVDKAREVVKQVESAKLALAGQKTETIYSEASNTFLSAARNYEVFFYMLIGAALIITVICLAFFPYSEETKVNFIFSKILTATLVITLGTLFLRKAAHLRKLHEQAHQTSLELQALPLYLVNVTPDHQAEIYKDLASKYFGKELDKTQHDKIGDLMSEQVKTSLEVFKTSSEIMKSMKPSATKEEDSEAKDKNKTE